MRRSKTVLAACAALALTGCVNSAPGGSPSQSMATNPTVDQEADQETRTRANNEVMTDFGSDHRFPSGLVVSVSAPDVFQPSEDAYPQAERAAAFGILLFNDSEKPYRLSDLAVKAIIDNEPAKQVKDTTQGYSGIVDADRDIDPGNTVRLKLAFAMQEKSNALQVILRPDSTTPNRVVFHGSV